MRDLRSQLLSFSSETFYGIFLPAAERLLVESKPLPRHLSKMMKMQDSLLKASAAELLRTDLLHVSTKQQQNPTESWCIIVQGRHRHDCILLGVVQ